MKFLKSYFKRYLWFYVLLISCFLSGAILTDEAVTVLAARPISHTVVIDPGHGGEDGGASSCTGVPESQLNLEIALGLRDLLNLLGYRTQMIRETDISVYTKGETLSEKKVSDLKHRVQMVEEAPNPLLLSIHQNQFPDGQYSGAQVFYNPSGKTWAEGVQQKFQEFLGSNRSCKLAEGIYLMEQISCPGILVECGFLSNPTEEALLRSPDYQKKLCCLLAASLTEVLRQESPVAI